MHAQYSDKKLGSQVSFYIDKFFFSSTLYLNVKKKKVKQ